MKNRILLIGLFIVLTKILDAQTVYLTENEKDIYWQPNTQIDFLDYQSLNKEECINYNEKYGLTMCSSIGIRGVVDIPKKRGKYDKFYIAPVFCKNCSCLLSKDSLSLQVDRLLFDVAEFCTRNARKELLEMQKEMNSDNTYSMFFITVKNKWDEKMHSISGTVIREILIEKKVNAYTSWRKTTDDVLQQTNDYATHPVDCYRFILNEPLEKGYKMAINIMGDMRNKKEEKE